MIRARTTGIVSQDAIVDFASIPLGSAKELREPYTSAYRYRPETTLFSRASDEGVTAIAA